MIHIKNLGWRLGNQLFQLAAAISLADQNGDSVFFPQWKYAKDFQGDFTPPSAMATLGRTYVQSTFNFNPIPYEKNMIIDGYFQSEKFFKPSENLIRSMFSFSAPLEDCSMTRDLQNWCSIHVRLGDYKNHPDHHPIKTWDNYYAEAINVYEMYCSGAARYLVFSDDIDAAMDIFEFNEYATVVYADEPNEITAMHMMSKCGHNIIGNSSFSWWAAWLNKQKNKTVIAPKDWFGPAYANYNLEDLIPESWIQI